MPYGSGQRLGESINPAHMQVDYSGYERAGATAGNMLANMGQQIGGIMKKYGDDEKTIKKAEQMAKSIRDAIPELAEMGNNALTELSNPDLSQRDRLAIAEGIQDSLKLGILGLERKDGDREFDFRERQFAAKLGMDQRALEASGANQPTIMDANQLQEQISSGAKVKYVPLGNGMYQVEGATANETPLIGGVYTDENGQIRQAPSGGGNIRIPGAGGIQNALPQGQGGQFPDGVPMGDITPIPGDGSFPNYGSFEQATQGVDVDGNAGVLPPRQGAAQQIQQAQQLVPNVPVPKGDVWRFDIDGLRAGQVEGSTNQIDYKTKEANLLKTQADTAAAAIKVEEANSASEKAAVNKQNDARFFLTKGNEAKEIIKESLGSGVGGASLDIMKSKVPGTQEYILEEQFLKPLRNGVALGNLQKMREESVTGASGLGALNEKEGERLETKGGNLKIGGDKNVLMGDITNLQKDMLDTVHGTKEQRAKWMKEGKITQADNDEVEAIYADYGFGVPKSTSPLQVPSHIQDIINKYK